MPINILCGSSTMYFLELDVGGDFVVCSVPKKSSGWWTVRL